MQRNFVNAGGLFMFGNAVPPDFIDDVLTSNLFYQLAASGQHDLFIDAEAWLREYSRLMVVLGQEASRREMRSITPEGQDSLWSMIKNALGKQISSGGLSQAEAVFTRLQNDNGTALKLLEQHTTQSLPSQADFPKTSFAAATSKENLSSRTVTLQLVVVDKAPFLTQVFISFKTSSALPSLSILPLIKQEQVVGNVELSLMTTELYADPYEDMKDTILEMLGPRRSTLIIELGESEGTNGTVDKTCGSSSSH
ncbi:hypothetical protein [Pseudomonas syringae]|nr:hypothetical protein [Pseudomonas syringae]